MQNTWQQLYFYRAKKIAKLLAIVPYVRAIFLTGSVARGQAKKKSDIDFFIVTKPGRIWTCRFVVTFIVQITGLRRHDKKISGRICLNRYQTADNLEIKPHTPYHRFDYAQVVCLLDLDDVENKYRRANKWIGRFRSKYKVSSIKRGYGTQKIGEIILDNRFGDFLEKILKNYQTKKILANPLTAISPKEKIKVSDKALCFHPEKRLPTKPTP